MLRGLSHDGCLTSVVTDTAAEQMWRGLVLVSPCVASAHNRDSPCGQMQSCMLACPTSAALLLHTLPPQGLRAVDPCGNLALGHQDDV